MISEHGSHTTGVLLSGGLDSSILAARLLQEGRRVRPFYIRSDLYWEDAELAAVRRYLEHLAARHAPRLEELVTLHLPLGDVYGEHWSLTGQSPPGADTPDEAVYLPGRNALLVVKAAVWCQLNGVQALALAPLRGNPFADATSEFFADFESALSRAGGPIRLERPFAQLSKRDVLELGRGLPLELTFSCIVPAGEWHCGACNKCGERRAAFAAAAMQDPTPYANLA
jgi:7-cyano-7-deazaguanine synthase